MKTEWKETQEWKVQNDNKPLWVRPPRDVTKDEYDSFFKTTFRCAALAPAGGRERLLPRVRNRSGELPSGLLHRGRKEARSRVGGGLRASMVPCGAGMWQRAWAAPTRF